MGTGLDIVDSFFPGSFIIPLIFFSRGPDIHVEDGLVALSFGQVTLGHDSLFDGIGGTNLHSYPAFATGLIDTVFFTNGVFEGDSLTILNISSPAFF